ncbi:hypothetical protein PTTG_10010 [Puccinia triticina 1-1 BBBD Race 1]|uniref:SLT domain-containing protein n=2 Tax=Puccinia triticina TaxID=208348 RepID=A0A0C4F9X5_PUCT1|nr:uncharacterized protein PtA15_13A448 [Puccinia triticina]OAV87081.1 hypothetical protein PTTG_10010 [Puccinia triticina 1-1 BBBD Race 1]WAQ91048.1 hypothetical protein PtA15_13A448 [Puccinia triticina]
MCFRSRILRLFTFTVLVSYLSLSSLASDPGRTPQLSSSKLLPRGNDDSAVTDQLKTYRKATKHKMKNIHRKNTQFHKKAKGKKACKTQHAKKSKAHKTKSKDNFNQEKEKYLLPTQPPALGSILHATSVCGSAQPTRSITESSGPNGSESFLNCGITGDGWKPAHVTISMLTHISLDQEPAKSTFAPCQKFRPLFEKHGQDHGIPAIFLAAFAMQESSCRPDVLGDQGGAFGLMQITKDKCGGAPGGNCSDPNYNIKMGAKTFADGLAEANGNVLQALGAYNGWFEGLTKDKAMEARKQGCCVCQQNLDYLQQFLNAWILGVDPHSRRLGTFRNLDVCESEH